MIKEKPFEFLKRLNNGGSFSDEIVKNWYIARSFVIDRLKDITFTPDSNKHLHVVLVGDDARMLSIARQVALTAHYINYDEDYNDEKKSHRTVITIVTQKSRIKEILSEEEYLCNLPAYCKYVDKEKEPDNIDSYVDIEIHISSDCPQKDNKAVMLFFHKADVDEFFNRMLDGDEDIFSIDTRIACYASRMYKIGETINNLPAENIHDAKRYTMALNVFQYEKLKEAPKPLFIDADNMKQFELRETLSNIFCSDCFESRALAVKCISNGNTQNETELWEKYNEVLSKSEHARWVVEKLIMGYRPLNAEERFQDEKLHVEFKGKEKIKNYRKSLKQNNEKDKLAHIDLCSYRDLRRINPDDLKYDSFLMLAIPKILKEVNKGK